MFGFWNRQPVVRVITGALVCGYVGYQAAISILGDQIETLAMEEGVWESWGESTAANYQMAKDIGRAAAVIGGFFFYFLKSVPEAPPPSLPQQVFVGQVHRI